MMQITVKVTEAELAEMETDADEIRYALMEAIEVIQFSDGSRVYINGIGVDVQITD
jgi:maleate cis-trans isomerase